MLLYDTLTKTKKEFTPRKDNSVDLFVCGPTVYDHAHIGHARTYIAFDAFVKYLRFKKYNVTYIQNITDIDDKIINRAHEHGKDALELSKEFEKEYYKDMDSLGINSVSTYARSTEYIPQIIKQIEMLLKKKYAYETKTGIYFEVSKYKDYGKLSGQDPNKGESREIVGEDKKHPADFALWKYTDEEPNWPFDSSPSSSLMVKAGRPGWHIEDTAITEELLGHQYDIHGGARDLIFPHHEAEIAQMETISGKSPLVNYWMHSGFLNIAGAKMSKSEGNFITIKDALSSWTKETFRLFVLTKHYRSPIEYNESSQEEFSTERMRIEEFARRLQHVNGKTSTSDTSKIAQYMESFWKHLDDDFNTPRAFATLFEMINTANAMIDKEKLGKKESEEIFAFLIQMNDIFGIATFEEQKIPKEIQKLADDREKARNEEDWKKADKLRKEIEKEGYTVKDTPSGPVVSRK